MLFPRQRRHGPLRDAQCLEWLSRRRRWDKPFLPMERIMCILGHSGPNSSAMLHSCCVPVIGPTTLTAPATACWFCSSWKRWPYTLRVKGAITVIAFKCGSVAGWRCGVWRERIGLGSASQPPTVVPKKVRECSHPCIDGAYSWAYVWYAVVEFGSGLFWRLWCGCLVACPVLEVIFEPVGRVVNTGDLFGYDPAWFPSQSAFEKRDDFVRLQKA